MRRSRMLRPGRHARPRTRAALPASILASLLGLLSTITPCEARAQHAAGQAITPRPEGVTPEIDLAVERGLRFLVENQRADGSWVGEGRSRRGDGSGVEQGAYPVAMTALAGVALLSSGSTVTRGPYSPSIRRAARYVLDSASSDGLFSKVYESGGWYEQRPMYGHAFSMMFLAQVLGQEESLETREEIQLALRNAIDLTMRAQSGAGGWYYYPNSDDDEGTLTVTMMQGLRACRDAGVHVPRLVIDRGVKYIESSVNPDGSVRYRSPRGEDTRKGVTCASVVALWSAGRYEDPTLKKIVNYVDRNIRAEWGLGGRHATYIQFYLAQSRFLLGGERWMQYYRKQASLLLGEQEGDGYWLTSDERSHGVGAVYSSSIALIILQLPYNRLPIFQR